MGFVVKKLIGQTVGYNNSVNMPDYDECYLQPPNCTKGEHRPVNLASRSKAQTVMPPSLTDSLTRSELRDLIKYLTTLKNAGSPK